MTLTVNTTDITSGPYAGNDVADEFDYDFRIEDKTQLTITETDDAGVQTTLVVDTDYTVAGIGDDDGGQVTRVAGALPTDYTWYIRSNYPETQDTAFSSQGAFFPDLHEAAMDKLTFLVQQLQDGGNRSFRLSDDIDIDGVFTLAQNAAARSGKYLSFNTLGDLIVTTDPQSFTADFIFDNVALMEDASLPVGILVQTRGYYTAGDGGGATYLTVTPQAFDGYGDHELANGNIAVLQYAGALNIEQYGCKGDGAFDNHDRLMHVLDIAIDNNLGSVFIPTGHFLFTQIKMYREDYTSTTFNEIGIVIEGVGRRSSWLDGDLKFDVNTTPTSYDSRWVGLKFKNLRCENSDGDALTFSAYGKLTIENCLVRGKAGIGLSLFGGSEFTSYTSEFYGSNTNVKIRNHTETGDPVDSAVISFVDSNISNNVDGGGAVPLLNIDAITNYRSVIFRGGNIISSAAESYFEKTKVTFVGVDFESTNPVQFNECVINATGNLFAVPTSPKIELTDSQWHDFGNVWDASVSQNIVIKDTTSTVQHYSVGVNPTIYIDHATLTNQIIYSAPEMDIINYDLEKAYYAPYVPSATVTVDIVSFLTGLASLGMTAGSTFITLPLEIGRKRISAFEFIATDSAVELYEGAVLQTLSDYGILYKLQDLTGGFNKYVFVGNITGDAMKLRKTFASSSVRLDSFRAYGDPVGITTMYRPTIPTSGTWEKGDKVFVEEPTPGGDIGWVCTTAGSPGTWKSLGTVAV